MLVWGLARPQVASAQWVVLLAIRLLVSRIPLISNKDLVIAGLALLLLGAHSAVAVLLAALAVMTLGLHLAVIVGLGLADLARGLQRAAITPSEMGRVVVESSVHD